MSITCPSCLTQNEETASACIACGTPLQTDNRELNSGASTYHLPPHTYLKAKRYLIEKTLGEGGFGITYKGIDCQTSSAIAIKELWPEKAVRQGRDITWSFNISPAERKQQLLKFQLEAKYQFQCKHPHICQVYDWFEENNTAYIIMQFISGKTLYQLLQEKPSIPETKIKKYFIEVAEALAVIHEKNLLHRDLKPDNILIDSQDNAIVIDFGATKEFLAGQTREMSVTLTAGYAPLEQYSYKSKRFPATDIYALCASMYEVATGQLPEAAVERLNAGNTDTLIPPRQLAPHLSPLLEQVILTGMNLRVENRFQSAEELIDALKGNFISPLHKKARDFLKSNQLEEAIATYQKCIVNEPNNGIVAVELALVQTHLDDKKAEQAANQAIKLNPQDGRSYGVLGLVFCRRNHWQEAEQNLKKGTQFAPKEAWIQANLAWALGKQKKWQEAQTSLNQALALNPNCPFSLGLQSWIAAQQKEWKTAIKGARQALFKSKQNQTNDVNALKTWVYPCLLLALDRAVVTKNAQDVDRCLNEYLTELPNDSFGWGFKGWKESLQGISPAVLSEFQKATRQGKPPYWVLMNLGITQEHRGQISEAIQTYEKAVKRFPNHPFAYLRLGTCLAQSEQWESAIAQLEKSVSLDSAIAAAHHNLAWSQLQAMSSLNQETNYHQILTTYEKAIELYYQQSRKDLANQIENAFANVGINLNDI